MKNPKYFRAFARYSVLSVLGTLGVSCYILADTFFVAQGLGTDGLTALNLAIPVYNLIHGSGLMLGMGGATLFSVVLGKQERNANRIYTQTLCLAAVFSAFFFSARAVSACTACKTLGRRCIDARQNSNLSAPATAVRTRVHSERYSAVLRAQRPYAGAFHGGDADGQFYEYSA